jgi:hypothetical protein
MKANITPETIKSLSASFNQVLKDHLFENHHISSFTMSPDDCDDPDGVCGPGKKLVIDTQTGQPICVDC